MNKISGLIIDTHVWLWLNEGSSELKSNIVKQLDYSAKEGELFVSVISIWEIATLESKKRIIFRESIKNWIEKALSQPGLELISLSPDVAVESAQLPNEFHGDPADRIIVASARAHGLTLATRDRKILKYAREGFVRTLEV